jgi:hypothetical protein
VVPVPEVQETTRKETPETVEELQGIRAIFICEELHREPSRGLLLQQDQP